LDAENLKFDHPNLSYEETILFMVANYQYLITCIAFSIAKPFRKEIWTNWPFFFCVVFLFVFNGLCIVLPASNRVPTRFDLQPFKTYDPDVSYYDYKVWIGTGILLNSILTYVAEVLIVKYLTKASDNSVKSKKEALFHHKMADYRS